MASISNYNYFCYSWFEKFYTTVLKFGFNRSTAGSALFIRHSSSSDIFLLLHVDNMIFSGSDVKGIQTTKSFLTRTFAMAGLGLLSYFLGLEVGCSWQEYVLSHIKYASDILNIPHLSNGKNGCTPHSQL